MRSVQVKTEADWRAKAGHSLAARQTLETQAASNVLVSCTTSAFRLYIFTAPAQITI